MLNELFVFFAQLFYIEQLSYQLDDIEISLFGKSNLTMSINTYLAMICSYIAFGFILVLCCLFIFKIIKLVGGLIR